ncbi:MAG: CheY-like chemotaxis protein [Rhodothermales bacterium]|jgi:CheY-like chemotaxis protein
MSLVLLLEADTSIREEIRQQLRSLSHSALTPDNGPEAAALAARHLPKCILVGRLRHPTELDGLLDALRLHPTTAESPIFFVPSAGSSELAGFLRDLPGAIERERPLQDAVPLHVDPALLPNGFRTAISNVLGESIGLAGRNLPPDQARALAVTLRETGQLLVRMGNALLRRPIRPDFDGVTELSVPLTDALRMRAGRTGRSKALQLSVEPCYWRGSIASIVEALADVVEIMLLESNVALSLRVDNQVINVVLIADTFQLPEAELSTLGIALREAHEHPLTSYRVGRLHGLIRVVRESDGTLGIHKGRTAGAKFWLRIPHRVSAVSADSPEIRWP